MTDKFFRPSKKGEIYYKIDWERMFQYVKDSKWSEIEEIETLCKIASARALDNIYNYGITTTGA